MVQHPLLHLGAPHGIPGRAHLEGAVVGLVVDVVVVEARRLVVLANAAIGPVRAFCGVSVSMIAVGPVRVFSGVSVSMIAIGPVRAFSGVSV